MSWRNYPDPLVLLVGPTAVGKTSLSISIAQSLPAEIISADSRYFYRGMNIGTAKPTIMERRSVVHHLIDIADPDQTLSLADFQQMAGNVISEIHNRDKLPMLVGGTGQYVRAVIEEWQMPEQIRDDRLREILLKSVQNAGYDNLYAYLRKVDPDAAIHIDPRNQRRTLRAVEVILKTGRKFSEGRGAKKSRYSRKMIGLWLERQALYDRIDARIDTMVGEGLIAEVDQLLQKGYATDLSSMSAIGYREITQYLLGKCSLEEAVQWMKRKTRQFVRRQTNWFREDDPTIRWFHTEQAGSSEIIDYINSEQGWILPGD